MKTPQFPEGNPSAPNKRNSIFSKREQRAIEGLLAGPLMREQLDRFVGCSNGPQIVKQIREKGVSIDCERVEARDRDGRPCKPGRYSLTRDGWATLERLL